VLVPAACLLLATGAAAAPAQHATTYKVTSTLDGKKVLPRRIVWTVNVSPAFPKSGVVDFLIDGKTVGFNYIKTSETYPDTGGYLVTTWLNPGTHTFTSRVRPPGQSHVMIDDTVTATTVAPPAPPAALAGTWERTVSDVSGAPKAGSSGNPTGTPAPAGTYKLTFDSRWIQAKFPGAYQPNGKNGEGMIIDNDWNPGVDSFKAYGGVQWKVLQRIDPEGGWWCYAGGPAGTYDWSISGNTLTLTPAGGSDPCGIRNFIWPGQWTRVG
jgi:hypothetical protein